MHPLAGGASHSQVGLSVLRTRIIGHLRIHDKASDRAAIYEMNLTEHLWLIASQCFGVASRRSVVRLCKMTPGQRQCAAKDCTQQNLTSPKLVKCIMVWTLKGLQPELRPLMQSQMQLCFGFMTTWLPCSSGRLDAQEKHKLLMAVLRVTEARKIVAGQHDLMAETPVFGTAYMRCRTNASELPQRAYAP